MDIDYDFFKKQISTGTTIIAAEFADGVVMGADSRTSAGWYVSNKVSDKLTAISEKIYVCRSGMVADTQALTEFVKYSAYLIENRTCKQPMVSDIAAEFRKFCYMYRGSVAAEIIIAGYDDVHKGQLYEIPLGGMLIRKKVALGGSGSTYLHGYVRETYKENMDTESCVDFVKKAIFHAMYHDGGSGGVCRLGIITKNGVENRMFIAPPIDAYPQ